MTLARRCLFLLLAIECVGAATLVVRQLRRPVPPEANWTQLDPVTADDLRATVASCKSAGDWRRLGEQYMATGCFTESEMCHRIACEFDPQNAMYRRQWGFALERLGLLDEANSQYLQCMNLSAEETNACRYFIGKNLLRQGDPAAAQKLFDDGKKLPANLFELTRLQVRARELAEATGNFALLAAAGPDMLQVNQLGYRLALAHVDPARARQLADRVRYSTRKLQSPFDEEARRLFMATQQMGMNRYQTQIEQLTASGQFNTAQRMLESLAANDRSATVLELLAENAFQQRDFDQAQLLFEELQQRHGPIPRITARVGDVWAAAGDATRARESWHQALQLQAGVDLQAVHVQLSDSYEMIGETVATRRHRAQGDYHSGLALLQKGDAMNATKAFADAVERDPVLTQAWFYLGESRRLTHQLAEARAAYQQCLSQNPNHGRALAALESL